MITLLDRYLVLVALTFLVLGIGGSQAMAWWWRSPSPLRRPLGAGDLVRFTNGRTGITYLVLDADGHRVWIHTASGRRQVPQALMQRVSR